MNPRRATAALFSTGAILCSALAGCSNTASEADNPTLGATPPVATEQPANQDAQPDLPAAPVTGEPEDPAQLEEDMPAADPEQPVTGPPIPAVDYPGEVSAEYVEDSLNAIHTALEDPQVQRDLTPVLSGKALGDYTNQQLEMAATGLHLEGEITIVDIRKVESPEPSKQVREVCVDNTGVRTLDSEGREIHSSQAAGRSKTLLTFSENGGAWTLSEVSFPDDPTC